MRNELIATVEQQMSSVLTADQMRVLREVMERATEGKLIIDRPDSQAAVDNNLLEIFISAKRVEGCTERTLRYYQTTLQKMMEHVSKPIKAITTDDLRRYLDECQHRGHAGKVTIDNTRRILSSFFSWLEDEDYIVKSPVRRIHKIKTVKTVKTTFSDEMLERMRDGCSNRRDLAMIDLLSSTGMRVGELVRLNKSDVDFESRECIVFGKGEKERKVYFDARAKLHLQDYLHERKDDNPALFVSLLSPANRLMISGVEICLRKLGQRLNIPKVHPHKFRRTLATTAIDKGMPVEQVQQLLGHSKIDTTMHYAMVSQNNVKESHRRYLG